MQLLVRAFAVLAGKEMQLRQFAHEIQTARSGAVAAFYQRLGVDRESWHLQETPHGSWVICVTQISERAIEAAGQQYAASQLDFDRWFKHQVMLVSGVNPDTTPLGPPTQCIFDSSPPRGHHPNG